MSQHGKLQGARSDDSCALSSLSPMDIYVCIPREDLEVELGLPVKSVCDRRCRVMFYYAEGIGEVGHLKVDTVENETWGKFNQREIELMGEIKCRLKKDQAKKQ